jgi:ribose 5-phosphate isomerase RpiB
MGNLTVGQALARELIKTFLKAKYRGTKRFRRRLKKAAALE